MEIHSTSFILPIHSMWKRADQFLANLVRRAGIWWVLVVVLSALAIYFFIQLALPHISTPTESMYLWQPLLWSGLALLAGSGWRYGLKERPSDIRLGWLVLVLVYFQIALLILAGLLQGFGRSPFDHRPLSMLGNLWYLVTMLLGMETSRAYLMGAMGRRIPWISLVLTAILFTLLTTSVGTISKFDSPRSAIEASGALLMPNLAENLLASLLAFGGGPLVSFMYRGVLVGFTWCSPFLPNPDWFIKALLGTLIPAFGMLQVHNHLLAQAAESEAANGNTTAYEGNADGFNPAWVLVGVVGLLLVGFNTGLFGVQPTLIASNSMSPTFWVGDVVVTKEVDAAEVAIGDIIRFQEGNHSTIHRVVEIQQTNNKRVFITRGDTNDANDPPVIEQALQGKLVMIVPKLGWLSIFVRRLIGGGIG